MEKTLSTLSVLTVLSLIYPLTLLGSPVSGWVTAVGDAGFSGGSEATASPVTTDADADTILANFPDITLADGESISLTGSVTFDVILSNNQFRIGVFNGDNPITAGDGTGFAGIFAGAPAGSTSSVRSTPGTASAPFSSAVGSELGLLPSSASPPANTSINFSLIITRDGSNLDISASFSGSNGYSSSITLQDQNLSYYTFNSAGFLFGGSHNGTQSSFSNIEITKSIIQDPLPPETDSDSDGFKDNFELAYGTDPHDRTDSPRDHVLGIDFNRDDAFAAPSQALFRTISGSTIQTSNSASYTKKLSSYQVTVTQPDSTNFEFRGANSDSSRSIPGGDTSLSYMVADFIATRKGAIDLTITNLPAGNYRFRSWHLDTSTGSTLGFAQGSTSTTPNTIKAQIGGVDQASAQPTSLGSPGLNTTYINDSQIPTLAFDLTYDGSSPLIIELRSSDTNGADNYLLMNGFEIFSIPQVP